MGDMEFGVVRNNVYKLAVTDIKKFGHAAKPDDDGDPEEPKDPDEEGRILHSYCRSPQLGRTCERYRF